MNELFIFPTNRMVRDFYTSFDECILPKALSIKEFFEKILLVNNLKLASDDRRILIMQEASKFENFKKLHIPQEFLAFLNSSDYLFRFFEELSLSLKEPQDLQNADTYAEFSEHLSILKTLFKTYCALLEKNGFYDAITLPKLYKINFDYLKRYEKITLRIEGFLNAFEQDILKQIAQKCELKLIINLNKYNQKMREFLPFLPQNGKFEIDLKTHEFTELKNDFCDNLITFKPFSLRSLQAGYVFSKIDEFIKNGITPEEIAVVLPDESFATILKAFDRANNLNFAMGFSFQDTLSYKKLNAINEYLSDESAYSKELVEHFLNYEKVEIFKKKWREKTNFADFNALLNTLNLPFLEFEQKLFDDTLFRLEAVLNEIELSLNEVFKLFLERLGQKKIDDANGGRVVVMGLLETRGAKFKGVIITDFNDEFVPRFSQKDMFLSTALRKHANLPTAKDREDLQRYFYHSLISNAEIVALSFTENEEAVRSRFLNELNAKEDKTYDENAYKSLLFDKHPTPKFTFKKDLIAKNTLFQTPLSASRLRKFLDCKRAYYFEYVEKIEPHTIPNDELEANEIGNFIHEALCKLYAKKDHFLNESELFNAFCHEIDLIKCQNISWQLEKEVIKEKMKTFCKMEVERFKDGWRVLECEKKYLCDFEGIQIEGKIDRIDIKGDKIAVIDYKTSRQVEFKENDFQLQFYEILCTTCNNQNVEFAGFYDVFNGSLLIEDAMQEKKENLKNIIEDLKKQDEINFCFQESDKYKFSPYKILLGKIDE